MSVILNEKEYVERIIEKGEVGKKPTSTLFLLSKYYRQEMKLSEKKTSEKLNEFMEKNYKDYNPALWEDLIEDVSRKGKKYLLQEIEYVGITENELSSIALVKGLKYQKLLFTMLCFAKLYNTISKTNNGWVNTEIPDLYRVARVIVKYKNDKFLYLNDLEKTKLISFSNKNDNLNMKVNFIDTEGEIILKITDFRELGYEYENYIGKNKFFKCSECGRLVKRRTNNQLYCLECSKKMNLEKQRERDKMKNLDSETPL